MEDKQTLKSAAKLMRLSINILKLYSHPDSAIEKRLFDRDGVIKACIEQLQRCQETIYFLSGHWQQPYE